MPMGYVLCKHPAFNAYPQTQNKGYKGVINVPTLVLLWSSAEFQRKSAKRSVQMMELLISLN